MTTALAPFTISDARAEGAPAAAPMLRLLKSGRLPVARRPTVVEMICQRGNDEDLRYVFDQILDSKAFDGTLRRNTIAWLDDAATTRKVRPSGDLGALGRLLRKSGTESSSALQIAAIRLAGTWRVKPLASTLQKISLNAKDPFALRQAATEALVRFGPEASLDTVAALTDRNRPARVRALGVAALTQLDLDRAAAAAASVFATADELDPDPIMAAFLARTAGAEKLAAAIMPEEIPAEIAKLALRYMYSIGRSDAPLASALADAAGMSGEAEPLTPKQVKELIADVLAKGDAARGETVFRRADLSCMNCHAVSKAGGQVGPDLSAIGSSTPIDYIVSSILQPAEAVKEEYRVATVVTADGSVATGIIAEENDERVVLRDATAKLQSIPAADILSREEGGTLMPQGLTRFLTRTDLVDLVRFLSELGKAGKYAVRSKATVQRWRLLRAVPDDLTRTIPDEGTITRVLEMDSTAWTPAYARVAGALPLHPLSVRSGGAKVLYIQGEVDVTVGGEIGLRLAQADGVSVWLDNLGFPPQSEIVTVVTEGRRRVTLRVDTTKSRESIRLEFFKPESAATEFTIVDGA